MQHIYREGNVEADGLTHLARGMGEVFIEFPEVLAEAFWGRWDGGVASGLPTCAWQMWSNTKPGAENSRLEPWIIHSLEAMRLDKASTVTSTELTGASRLLKHIGETFMKYKSAPKRHHETENTYARGGRVYDSCADNEDAHKRARKAFLMEFD